MTILAFFAIAAATALGFLVGHLLVRWLDRRRTVRLARSIFRS